MKITTRSIIHIGTPCNLNCKHCYYYNDKIRKWKNIFWLMGHLILIRLCRMDKLDVSGGEPTIYPKRHFLMWFCTFIGFKEIRLVTNGTQWKKASKLAEKYKNVRFSLSLHSPVESDMEELTGSGLVLDRIRKFVYELGDRINYVNCVITPFNTDILTIAQRITAITGDITLCFKHLDYNFTHGIEDFPTHLYRRSLNTSIRNLLLKKGEIEINMRFFPFCFLDEDLLEHKQVKCCSAITNNYDPNDWLPLIGRKTKLIRWIKFIFGSEKIREHEAKEQAIFQGKFECANTKTCKHCRYLNTCDGTQKGYLKLFGDKEFRPMP